MPAVVIAQGRTYVRAPFCRALRPAPSSSSARSSHGSVCRNAPSLEIVRMTRVPAPLALAAVALLLAACDEYAPPTSETTTAPTAAFATAAPKGGSAVALLNRANSTLAAKHEKFRVAYAEWVTTDGAQEAGQIVFADDIGNKHTGAHFVAGDPRRDGRDFITYLVDQSDGATHTGTGLTNAQTEAAIDRAL